EKQVLRLLLADGTEATQSVVTFQLVHSLANAHGNLLVWREQVAATGIFRPSSLHGLVAATEGDATWASRTAIPCSSSAFSRSLMPNSSTVRAAPNRTLAGKPSPCKVIKVLTASRAAAVNMPAARWTMSARSSWSRWQKPASARRRWAVRALTPALR